MLYVKRVLSRSLSNSSGLNCQISRYSVRSDVLFAFAIPGSLSVMRRNHLGMLLCVVCVLYYIQYEFAMITLILICAQQQNINKL